MSTAVEFRKIVDQIMAKTRSSSKTTKKVTPFKKSVSNDNIPSNLAMKRRLFASLREQGYTVNGDSISLPDNSTKDDFRDVQQHATKKILEKSEKAIRPYENRLINYIANGDEVIPEKIEPELILVEPRTENELLFRYAALHWSIPISSGYGRRMRFLLMDKNNGKLIGIFALGDPVFGLKARDEWVGWNREARRQKLYQISSFSPRPAQPPQSLNPPSQREKLETSEFDLYDSQGKATAFLDLSEGLTIYLWAGKPVAYLDGDSIYGFNGKHLGWYLKGIVYDQDGYIVLAPARTYSVNVERAPPRGLKVLKPIKGLKDLKPLKPLFGSSWSKYPSWFFLAQGVVLTR